VGAIKDTIKHMLETLISLYGADIFSKPNELRKVMNELFASDTHKKSRNLLGIALGEMDAYSRLRSLRQGEFLSTEALAKEMHDDYDIIAETTVMVMEAISEVAAASVLRIDEPRAPIIGLQNRDTSTTEVNAVQDDVETIHFGKYRWRVLTASGKHQLIIATDIIMLRDWGKEHRWPYCEIRGYLNGAFFNSFTPDERRQIQPHGLTGSIFLLTSSEANAYFHGDADRIIRHGDDNVDWWLLSSERNRLDCVTKAGRLDNGVHDDICNETKGIRPVLWLIDNKKSRKRR